MILGRPPSRTGRSRRAVGESRPDRPQIDVSFALLPVQNPKALRSQQPVELRVVMRDVAGREKRLLFQIPMQVHLSCGALGKTRTRDVQIRSQRTRVRAVPVEPP